MSFFVWPISHNMVISISIHFPHHRINLSRFLDFSEFSISWYFVSLSLSKLFLVSESMSGVQERMLLSSCCLYTFLLFVGLEFSSIAFFPVLPLRPSFPAVSGHRYSAVRQALTVNSEHLPWSSLTPCELHLLLILSSLQCLNSYFESEKIGIVKIIIITPSGLVSLPFSEKKTLGDSLVSCSFKLEEVALLNIVKIYVLVKANICLQRVE